jgi:hypothetical protein
VSGILAPLTTGLITDGTIGTINDTSSGVFTFAGTNAQAINAGTSGGILMTAADSSNGAAIAGSTTKGNAIDGSAGVDSISVGSGTNANTIATNGGTASTATGSGDAIALGAHVSTSATAGGFVHIDDYVAAGTAGITAGTDYTTTASGIVATGDLAQAGWFGLQVGGAPAVDGTLTAAAGIAGVSTSQAIVTGFVPGGAIGTGADTVVFSIGEWSAAGAAAAGVTDKGLVSSRDSTPVAAANAVFDNVLTGGSTMVAGSNVHPISASIPLANAAALATWLSTNVVNFSAADAGAKDEFHMIFVYQDGSGNAHIADVDFLDLGGATAAKTTDFTALGAIHASDMVQLTGVSEAQVLANAHNISFIA